LVDWYFQFLLLTLNFFIYKMNSNYYKYSWLTLVSLLISVNSAIAVNAENSSTIEQQNLIEHSSRNTIYLSKNNHSREYTFKAPDNKTLRLNPKLLLKEI